MIFDCMYEDLDPGVDPDHMHNMDCGSYELGICKSIGGVWQCAEKTPINPTVDKCGTITEYWNQTM